jgi:flagellar motor switch protein FliG
MIVDAVENRTFDELQVGDSASVTQTLAPEQLQLVATLLGDLDPQRLGRLLSVLSTRTERVEAVNGLAR